MAEDPAGLTRGYITFADMQICAADGCLGYFDDGVSGHLNFWFAPLLKFNLGGRLIHEGLHGRIGGTGRKGVSCCWSWSRANCSSQLVENGCSSEFKHGFQMVTRASHRTEVNHDTDAGIAGALLIVVGLVAAAISSPIIDRTKAFVTWTKSAVPIIGLCYLVFVWMPGTRSVAGPYIVLSVLGAASFSLIPVVIELLVELTHPISPEVTSTLAWSGGQLLGGCFIVISDALKAGEDGTPPGNMYRALVFTAVIAMAVLPLPLCLGLFGRGDNVTLKRMRSDAGERASVASV